MEIEDLVTDDVEGAIKFCRVNLLEAPSLVSVNGSDSHDMPPICSYEEESL